MLLEQLRVTRETSPAVNKQEPGSDASQPRRCQVAPDVPGWGELQPKIVGEERAGEGGLKRCQKVPACLEGGIQRSGVAKCFNREGKTCGCGVKCVNRGDSALVVPARQHPQHPAPAGRQGSQPGRAFGDAECRDGQGKVCPRTEMEGLLCG